ncbi:MAG TPA: hypothetical protein VMV65_01185 [Alphaproteobacteria bacterium]|nr:hypothetical protein [Alphaproteobacteria bacterium]
MSVTGTSTIAFDFEPHRSCMLERRPNAGGPRYDLAELKHARSGKHRKARPAGESRRTS